MGQFVIGNLTSARVRSPELRMNGPTSAKSGLVAHEGAQNRSKANRPRREQSDQGSHARKQFGGFDLRLTIRQRAEQEPVRDMSATATPPIQEQTAGGIGIAQFGEFSHIRFRRNDTMRDLRALFHKDAIVENG